MRRRLQGRRVSLNQAWGAVYAGDRPRLPTRDEGSDELEHEPRSENPEAGTIGFMTRCCLTGCSAAATLGVARNSLTTKRLDHPRPAVAESECLCVPATPDPLRGPHVLVVLA